MKNVLTKALTLSGLFAVAINVQAGGFSQSQLPKEVQVPAGNQMVMATHAKGNITWKCEDKGGKAAWKFAGPRAILTDIQGNHKVSYYGGPATWEALDGSVITGKQLATSPSKAGSIPMQLVKANPSPRDGELKGVTYIQRINLNGGKAPAEACTMNKIGHTMIVNYSGDYLFWKAK
ncbi:DUF3455 domain-containing protein [Thiomicrorhabdus sp. 6S2-11]|uniref:DUF3455 domain-containing protein n=1 Tax=Thiomicrorhabdus marina TaxID=2818442 RepID=A0ABS3Q7E1_9GAMM|nr:DUF3455 domain-containing protein [Thiomicrorhabdus marina]MBO1928273.1 DUF3455 domain-containing protein [Thiomicrorhabdus marina]